jgi:hypothetical protein
MSSQYEALRPHFLRNARNHFIASAPADWFTDCLIEPEAPAWSQAASEAVEAELRANCTLDSTGWTELRQRVTAEGADENFAHENFAYAPFVDYSEKIAVALENVLAQKGSTAPGRTTRYHASEVAGSNEAEGPGYEPKGRFVLKHSNVVANHPSSPIDPSRDESGAKDTRNEGAIDEGQEGDDLGHLAPASSEENESECIEHVFGAGNLGRGPAFCNADSAGVVEWNLFATRDSSYEVSFSCLSSDAG